MATPPRMLPTATPSSSERAALAVMAISGRLVTMASMINPPRASPKPKREESTSVVLESLTPATHTKAAAPPKINSRSGSDDESNIFTPSSKPRRRTPHPFRTLDDYQHSHMFPGSLKH